MKHFEINASLRNDVGKKASKKIRREDNIPCVIYGGGKTLHFFTSQSDIRKFVYTPEVMFADIKLDGKSYSAIVKDIQFHPVTDKIIHIDFYELNEAKKVKIKIPVHIIGSSVGVKAGGKLKQNMRKITVKAMMNDIPDKIEVDITELNIGDSIRIRDLKSDKLEFVDTKTNIVVTIISMRGIIAAEEAAAALEAAEKAEKAEKTEKAEGKEEEKN
ncbi:MAG TPA: 50S ribosomal protein L25/general stress protein Ctc [Bacteroidales bacterium]|nr:50S ribosomal protein L25/general stress protein Ctc [Bacteroidales bacterium]